MFPLVNQFHNLKACQAPCLHAVLEEVRLHVVDEAGGGLPAVHHPRQAVLAVLKTFLCITFPYFDHG